MFIIIHIFLIIENANFKFFLFFNQYTLNKIFIYVHKYNILNICVTIILISKYQLKIRWEK